MSYVPAKKNTAYIFYAGLVSRSTGQFQANPTLAAGDFKVSIDGGALNNLATLPTVTPAASKMVKISLSAAEMNGDNITIVVSDVAGAEWDDCIVNIQTSVSQIDDLATSAALAAVQADTDDIQTRIPAALSGDGFMKADLKSIEDELTDGNNAILRLRKLDITNSVNYDSAVTLQAGLGADGLRIIGGGAIPEESSAGRGVVIAGGIDNGTGQGGAPGLVVGAGDGQDAVIFIAGYGGGNSLNLRGEAGKSIYAPQGIFGSDLEDLSVTNITDKNWDEATAGHATAGTTGKALTDAGSAGDPWTTVLPGAYGAGTAGDIIGNRLDMPISDVPTANENADALLKRDWTAVTGEAARSVLNALRKIRNKVSFDGVNTLTVTKEDDATTAYTQGVVEDANQDPFKEVG